MVGLSEFEVGIAIVNMGGSDFERARNIVRLLDSYEIPTVVVLDRDAEQTEEDLNRMKGKGLEHLREVFRLKKGTIEDYYPEEIVAAVINSEFSPESDVSADELRGDWSGRQRLDHFKRVMHEHGAGSSLEYLKSALGRLGTRLLKDSGYEPDPEIQVILRKVEEIARET